MRLSAAELAGLPGMPSTRRGVYDRAQRDGWESSEHPIKGRVYPVDVLPLEARQALDSLELPSTTEIEGRTLASANVQTWQAAPAKACRTAIERAQLVSVARRLRASQHPWSEIYARLQERYGVPERSLRRWCKAVKNARCEDWAFLLLPKYQTTKALSPIHPEAWEWLLSDYLRLSRPGLSACYRRLLDAAQHHPKWGDIPSEQSLRRRLSQEVQPSTLQIRRDGLEAFEQTIPAQRRDKSGLAALQHVNADGHRFDVFIRWPNLNPNSPPSIVRPVMMAWQDVYSGKILSWRLDVTENGDCVRLAFADMLRDWGIPDQATIDNGHAFASKKMTGGWINRHRFKWVPEEPDGIYKSFGIQVHFALPYHGQSKPIERAFRDLCEDIAKHPLCQGAYTGNRPTAKPEDYKTRAVDYDDFVELVEAQIAKHNARQGRRGGVCRGRSIDEVFESSFHAEGRIIRRATEAQLRWLMLPIEGCKVSKDEACITLMGNRFWDPALLQHRGEKMVVRFDPYDIQAGIWVFENGAREPLCRASCILPVGFSDTDAARRDARKRAALLKAAKKIAHEEGTIPAQQLAGKAKPKKPTKSGAVVRAEFGRTVPERAKDTLLEDGQDLFLSLGRAHARKQLGEEKLTARKLRSV